MDFYAVLFAILTSAYHFYGNILRMHAVVSTQSVSEKLHLWTVNFDMKIRGWISQRLLCKTRNLKQKNLISRFVVLKYSTCIK